MKVAVLSGIKKISIENRPKPLIGPGEALVKIACCGICGSDVHSYLHAIFFPIGTVMGHEASGVVSEVGERVNNVKIGDRVAIIPCAPCRFCDACMRGQDNLCYGRNERDLGQRPGRDGAFAEYIRIPWPEEILCHLPDEISFEEGAFIEPLATSFHGVRQSRLKPGDKVVVAGAGPIGLGVLQWARLGGAQKVIVLEISSERSRVAQDLGADVILNPAKEGAKLFSRIAELTGGMGADIYYECAGAPESLQNSIHCVRKGGQVMVIGATEKNAPIQSFQLVLYEVDVQGSFAYTKAEFQMVIDLLAQKKINTASMLSTIISLEDIEEKGFKTLVSSPSAVKILVRP